MTVMFVMLEQLRAAVEVGLVGPFPSGLSHWPSVYIGSINHGVMRSIVELFVISFTSNSAAQPLSPGRYNPIAAVETENAARQ